MAVQLQHKLFTTDEYHTMLRTGVLSEDDRLELIDGEIVTMSPIGPVHAAYVNRLTRLFVTRCEGRALIAVQNPIWLGSRSEPQPDLSVLRVRADDYSQAHPTADDIYWLVEVADSSSEADRAVKIPLYARAGVREVWLVDIEAHWIEVYTNPAPAGYRSIRRALPGESLSPAALPDLVFEIDEILK